MNKLFYCTIVLSLMLCACSKKPVDDSTRCGDSYVIVINGDDQNG